ncbi:hypothetical protein [Macrococcoides caseolyticum]|uniref:hypothetical protein n=1 Tax=Macrococcoides caseolyticum TaxID=69966 RepID=UPI000C325DCA|nr:hypothetical protein [Macrococcus caseolyticus]PKE63920.1 hypothetical protein CW683_03000 [Macrococcus caseolyticus]
MQISIPDEFIEELVMKKVEEKLNDCKHIYASINMKKLVELTGLSKTTLTDHYTNHPDFMDITVKHGTRVLYLYPECLEVYRKLIKEKQKK